MFLVFSLISVLTSLSLLLLLPFHSDLVMLECLSAFVLESSPCTLAYLVISRGLEA